MKYIILDLEWNQAIRKFRLHLEGEIIQIGAVKLDDFFQKIETFKIGIAPKYYKKMHWKVAELTHISEADFAYGFSFPAAFKYFKDWCGEEFAFLTWGCDDLRILKANMGLYKLDYSWIPAVYDLQRIFDRQIARENRQCSLLYAMEMIGKVPLEAHDALHDALNTYEVCRVLDLNRAIEEYPSYYDKKAPVGHEAVPRLKAETYPNKKTAVKAVFQREIPCPCCGRSMERTAWVQQNDKKYISLAKCTCGQEYFARVKCKRSPANRYSVSMVIYPLDPQLTAYYFGKRLKKVIFPRKMLFLPEISQASFRD